MIRDVQQPRLFRIVVAADEIIFRLLRHVGGRNGNILISGDIHALAVVVLIVHAGRNGEAGDIPLAVVHHRVHIRWKYRLGVIIDRHSRVRPPQEGLRHRRAVVELSPDLDVRLVRIQREADDPLRPVHLVHVVHEKRPASVRVFLNHMVHRHKGCRPVMLRPVEFDPARDPRTAQAHQRRLDHLIIVHEIVPVRFVIGPLDPTAQLRQNHDFYVFILQKHRVPDLILLHRADRLRRRIRVDLSAAALINTLFQKHRVFIRRAHLISRDHDRFLPDFYFLHALPPSLRCEPLAVRFVLRFPYYQVYFPGGWSSLFNFAG